MDKLRMQSLDKTKYNVERLKELFPNIVTEFKGADGKIGYAIDFDVLKQELSSEIVEGREERYQFTWPGKREAILLANSPITKTLRPCKGESVNFDKTQNLYIEGDNLNVLKLLQEPYLGKVKMIYIDPPYNTGNDFIYNDKFVQDKEGFEKTTGQRDEKGNRMVQNPESNGRFHSDWCSMIYPRLKLAKDLLSDDGVIFISIDDNEQENLKKICNEIFGEGNFVAQFDWMKTSTPPSLSKNVRKKFEYVLCYSKKNLQDGLNGGVIDGGDMPLLNESNSWRTLSFNKDSVRFKMDDGIYTHGERDRVVLEDDVYVKDGRAMNDFRLSGNFKWTQETLQEETKKGAIFWVKTDKFAIRYERPGKRIKVPSNIISKDECDVGTNEDAQKDLLQLFGSKVMDYPKPVSLIHYLTRMITNDRDTVLDFFSGSATTAHAVMQLNAEDGGHRKFIMVQVPPYEGDEEGDAAGENENICEIGKERIRRAGKKILEDNPSARGSLDVGFRVLKLKSSNMKDVYYDPVSTKQQELIVKNVKDDRGALDLLFQALLEFDKPLSSKIEEAEICGKTVFKVDGDDMICCLEEGNISDELVEAITKLKPLYAIFRDSSFSDDSVRVNCGQLFAKFSPKTVYRVI